MSFDQTIRRSRSRSRSPYDFSDYPLKLAIPNEFFSQLSGLEFTERLRKENRVDINVQEKISGNDDAILSLENASTTSKLSAFSSVICIQIIDEMAILYQTPEFTVIIFIPSGAVSSIIGRQGQQIKSIQQSSDANVSVVDKPDRNTGNTKDRIIKIKAKPSNIKDAAEKIFRIVVERKISSPRRESRPSPVRRVIFYIDRRAKLEYSDSK